MDFRGKSYEVFKMFSEDWAIATAGSLDDFNGCTLGWGSLGNLWSPTGKESRSIINIYVHPARYTSEYLLNNDFFTVSFFPEEYRKAIAYMGSHSGRDDRNKAISAGLTPILTGESVGYKEANLIFLCKKIYQHQFYSDDLAAEIQDYYQGRPEAFPDFKGGWQPHIVFVGEIIDVIEKD